MLTTCWKCRKQNDYWESIRLKEPIILKGEELYGCFAYSKYFCPLSERKIKDKSLLENQEKVLITDCLNGNREEIRDKVIKGVAQIETN